MDQLSHSPWIPKQGQVKLARKHQDGRRLYNRDLSDLVIMGTAPENPPIADGGRQRRQQAGGPQGAAISIDLLQLFVDDPLLLEAVPPGVRWITVRPTGPGSDGHPVLIQPSDDGA